MGSVLVVGCAAPYNVPGHNIHRGWRPMFARGAFRWSIDHGMVSLVVNHSDNPIAHQADHTLTLVELTDGLRFHAHVKDPRWGGVLADAQRNGVLKGMSTRYSYVGAIGDRSDASGVFCMRERVPLFHVSLTIGAKREPAFPGTWAEIEE